MLCAGIDAGSRAIKIVVLDTDGPDILAAGVVEQGINADELSWQLLDKLLNDHGRERSEIERAVATGYSRARISAAQRAVTEITCHARGVRHLVPGARTVVEIGGQDSKLLKLDEGGAVQDFQMNDRCAAGTGRFLEVVADKLKVGIDELGEMATRSETPAVISSTCIVFAETEIIGLLSSGVPAEDIVSGIQNSIASRMSAMAGGSITPPVVFTGGVALVPGMRGALERVLNQPVSVAPMPQMTGALGAALTAWEKAT